MPLANMKNRCTAHSKKTGERCQNPAVTGYTVCMHHGANPKNHGGRTKGCDNSKSKQGGPPVGNTNGATHGAYTAKLPPDELPVFEQILADYLSDVPNPSSTDRRALERLAILETKWQVAVTQGAPAEALDVLHRLLHRELKALQVTRESKDTARTSGTTPAEVVASLLLRIRERQGLLPAPLAVSGRVIDAELVGAADDVNPEEGDS
ncbi:MAG: hypothetical protein PHD83_06365 [Caldisericia bacterium]|nr:hypothetical protein [Caldisericia bacterium]